MSALNRLIQIIESKLVGNLGFVYHRTPAKNLNVIKQNGLKIFKDSVTRGRSLYGVGLYSCYDLQSQLNARMIEFYGNTLIRCFVKTANYFDFDAFSNIGHPRHKEMRQKGKILNISTKLASMPDEKKDNYDEGFTSELALLCYKDCMKHFDGIIFTGKQDGKTCVTYKPDTIKAQAYCQADTDVTSTSALQWTPIGLKQTKGPDLDAFIEKYRLPLKRYNWKPDIGNKAYKGVYLVYKKDGFSITVNDNAKHIKFSNEKLKGFDFKVLESDILSFIKNPKSWFDARFKSSNQAKALPILQQALKAKGFTLKTRGDAFNKHSIVVYSKNKIPYDVNYFQTSISFDNSMLDEKFEEYDYGLRLGFQKDHTDLPIEALTQRINDFAATLIKYIDNFETRYTLDYPYFKYRKLAKSNGWELSSDGDQTTSENLTFRFKKERNVYLDCYLRDDKWHYRLHVSSNRLIVPETDLEKVFKDPFKLFNHTNSISYAMLLLMRGYVQKLGYSTFTKTYKNRSVVKIRSKDKTKKDYARFEMDGDSLYYAGREGYYLHENDQEEVQKFKDLVKTDLELFFKDAQ